MALKIVVKSKSFRSRCIWVLILALMLTGQKIKNKKRKPQASYLNSLILSFIVIDLRIIIPNLLACFKH